MRWINICWIVLLSALLVSCSYEQKQEEQEGSFDTNDSIPIVTEEVSKSQEIVPEVKEEPKKELPKFLPNAQVSGCQYARVFTDGSKEEFPVGDKRYLVKADNVWEQYVVLSVNGASLGEMRLDGGYISGKNVRSYNNVDFKVASINWSNHSAVIGINCHFVREEEPKVNNTKVVNNETTPQQNQITPTPTTPTTPPPQEEAPKVCKIISRSCRGTMGLVWKNDCGQEGIDTCLNGCWNGACK
jgi:hypothetical protein